MLDGKRLMVGSGEVVNYEYNWGYSRNFRIVSRAEATPKLWRDMTPEEKGALLLAMHNGKKVEIYSNGKWLVKSFMTFADDYTYRIKPEPKVETVHLMNFHELAKGHAIVFTVKDGEPDCTSIKMEKL